jgi:DNA-directed RNA polymerase specialized sigma24 family protein
MHKDEKKSYQEIAKIMGMTANAVNICNCRTKKKMEDIIINIRKITFNIFKILNV